MSSFLHVATPCVPTTQLLLHQCDPMPNAFLRVHHSPMQAGQEFTAGLAARDDHALMVARLRHERAAREALVRQLDGLRAQKVDRVKNPVPKFPPSRQLQPLPLPYP